MSLIVFVDALPFGFVNTNRDLFGEWKPEIAPYEPSFGYSSNLHWEIFADKYPDDVGFFTDWNYAPAARRAEPKAWRKISARALYAVEKIPYFGFSIRYLLNKMTRGRYANIPFYIRKYFKNNSRYLLSRRSYLRGNSLFENFDIILKDEQKMSDEAVLQALDASIQSGEKNIFATFGFADRLGHMYGTGRVYERAVRRYFATIIGLVDQYVKMNPAEKYLVFSDHGMTTVTQTLSSRMEKEFGMQEENRYFYFCDSVILRVWTENEKMKSEIEKYLNKYQAGRLLDENDRRIYGLSNRKYGDLIFSLSNGRCFKPNYFGIGLRERGRGMHGYFPGHADQNGVVISNERLPKTIKTKELHSLIKNLA